MDILEQILKQVSTKESLNSLGSSLEASPSQVKDATEALVPALLGSMSKNAQSENGLQSLFSALSDHQDDDVSDINGFLGGLDLDDAAKMVGHILGNNNSKLQSKVAKETGMSATDVGSLTTMLAPLIMGLLGNQKKQQSGFDMGSLVGMLGGAGDITSLLGNLLGSNKPAPKKTAAGQSKTSTNKKVTSVKSSKKESNDLLDSVTDLLGNLLNKK
jgi:hypothetical protein